LQHSPTARLLGEFRIEHLIRPRSQRTGRSDAAKNIGSSEPPTVPQCWLDDDLNAGTHRFCGTRHELIGGMLRKIFDLESFRSQLVDVTAFMVQAARLKNSERRV
jgi:hypothetical protein